MTAWPANAVAAYDQGMAEADAELDRLVLTLRGCTRKRGEMQGAADVGALLQQLDVIDLSVLLVSALGRLAQAPQ